jgi:hypothetical protein
VPVQIAVREPNDKLLEIAFSKSLDDPCSLTFNQVVKDLRITKGD